MRKYLIASLLAVAVLSGSASASLIIGDIGVTGTLDTKPTSGNLGTATGVDILGDTAIVNISTGDFAANGVAIGSVATFVDFVFAPFSAVTPLWTVGGFSFDLANINIDFQSAKFLNLSGTGTVTHANFSPTPGEFTFTGNGPKGVFNFASVVSTPEPTSLLVWGGLAMAGIVARRRRTS